MLDLNVCTMAIPRRLVGKCIGSLLDNIKDRDQYRLHWRCWLDDYPGLGKHHGVTLKQINRVAERFLTAEVGDPGYRQGFGGSVYCLLRHVRHDVLWVGDDWLWIKPFSLARVLEQTDDCFTFVGGKAQAGVMHPTVWRRHVVAYLLAHWPEGNMEAIHEGTIRRIVSPKHELAQDPEITGQVCRHIGDKQLAKLGITHREQ